MKITREIIDNPLKITAQKIKAPNPKDKPPKGNDRKTLEIINNSAFSNAKLTNLSKKPSGNSKQKLSTSNRRIILFKHFQNHRNKNNNGIDCWGDQPTAKSSTRTTPQRTQLAPQGKRISPTIKSKQSTPNKHSHKPNFQMLDNLQRLKIKRSESVPNSPDSEKDSCVPKKDSFSGIENGVTGSGMKIITKKGKGTVVKDNNSKDAAQKKMFSSLLLGKNKTVTSANSLSPAHLQNHLHKLAHFHNHKYRTIRIKHFSSLEKKKKEIRRKEKKKNKLSSLILVNQQSKDKSDSDSNLSDFEIKDMIDQKFTQPKNIERNSPLVDKFPPSARRKLKPQAPPIPGRHGLAERLSIYPNLSLYEILSLESSGISPSSFAQQYHGFSETVAAPHFFSEQGNQSPQFEHSTSPFQNKTPTAQPSPLPRANLKSAELGYRVQKTENFLNFQNIENFNSIHEVSEVNGSHEYNESTAVAMNLNQQFVGSNMNSNLHSHCISSNSPMVSFNTSNQGGKGSIGRIETCYPALHPLYPLQGHTVTYSTQQRPQTNAYQQRNKSAASNNKTNPLEPYLYLNRFVNTPQNACRPMAYTSGHKFENNSERERFERMKAQLLQLKQSFINNPLKNRIIALAVIFISYLFLFIVFLNICVTNNSVKKFIEKHIDVNDVPFGLKEIERFIQFVTNETPPDPKKRMPEIIAESMNLPVTLVSRPLSITPSSDIRREILSTPKNKVYNHGKNQLQMNNDALEERRNRIPKLLKIYKDSVLCNSKKWENSRDKEEIIVSTRNKKGDNSMNKLSNVLKNYMEEKTDNGLKIDTRADEINNRISSIHYPISEHIKQINARTLSPLNSISILNHKNKKRATPDDNLGKIRKRKLMLEQILLERVKNKHESCERIKSLSKEAYSNDWLLRREFWLKMVDQQKNNMLIHYKNLHDGGNENYINIQNTLSPKYLINPNVKLTHNPNINEIVIQNSILSPSQNRQNALDQNQVHKNKWLLNTNKNININIKASTLS